MRCLASTMRMRQQCVRLSEVQIVSNVPTQCSHQSQRSIRLIVARWWIDLKKQILHTKLVLRKKRDEIGNIKRNEARYVVCGNGEGDNDEESFSAVSDVTILKTFYILPNNEIGICDISIFRTLFRMQNWTGLYMPSSHLIWTTNLH